MLTTILREIIEKEKYEHFGYHRGICVSKTGMKKILHEGALALTALLCVIFNGEGTTAFFLFAVPMAAQFSRKSDVTIKRVLWGILGFFVGMYVGALFSVMSGSGEEPMAQWIVAIIIMVVYAIRANSGRWITSIAKLAEKEPNRPISEIISEDTYIIEEELKRKLMFGGIAIIAAAVIIPLAIIFTTKTELKFRLNEDGTGYIVERYKENIFDKGVKVNIPDSYKGLPVAEIDGGAFNGRDGLVEVVIPESVTYIGGEAFMNCENLVSVVLPDNLEHIKGDTFSGCAKLTEINLPESLLEIHANAFYYCRHLPDPVFPEKLQRIGAHAFDNCDALENLTFPESLEEIGSSAFRDCDRLKEAHLPEDTKYNIRAFKGSPTEIYGGREYDPDKKLTVPKVNYEYEPIEIPEFTVPDYTPPEITIPEYTLPEITLPETIVIPEDLEERAAQWMEDKYGEGAK